MTVGDRTVGTGNIPRGRGLPTTRHDVEFDIEFEAVNPDVDEIISDGYRAAYAVTSQGTGIVRLYIPPRRQEKSGRKYSSH